MRGSSTALTTGTATQPVTTNSLDVNSTIATGAIVILLPLTFVCITLTYRRYRKQLLQKRIAKLERSFCLLSNNTSSGK